MADRPPSGQRPPAYRASVLSRSEFEARGRTRRRQVRRRRVGALLAVGVIAAAIVTVVLGQSGGARSGNPTVARVRHPPAPAKTMAVVDQQRSFTEQTTAAIKRVLAYTPYITVGRPRRREIALTFDDGPGPYTLRILAVLEQQHIHGTFFEIGRSVNLYPSVTKRLAEAGEAIGDHTEDRPLWPRWRPSNSAKSWSMPLVRSLTPERLLRICSGPHTDRSIRPPWRSCEPRSCCWCCGRSTRATTPVRVCSGSSLPH